MAAKIQNYNTGNPSKEDVIEVTEIEFGGQHKPVRYVVDKTIEDVEKIQLRPPRENKTTYIGSALPDDMKQALTNVLAKNVDLFAFNMNEMTGISEYFACHKLDLIPGVKTVKQKPRRLNPNLSAAALEEIKRLHDAQIIRPIAYSSWLSNMVVVPKKNGKIRVCIDFTDLNKACLKDLMPRVDDLVRRTAGFELLSFMDGFAGYNQIPMRGTNEEKKSFITEADTYCYRRMPFGLKNTGATYQKLVNNMFRDRINKDMEVYIDNMLVKSFKTEDHIADLSKTFATLLQYGMKLNPEKCAFGVSSGKFLGYLVSRRGIEALIEMPSQTKKQVQKLAGKINALGRFISKSSDKCRPIFNLLKKQPNFVWNTECEVAFQQLK